MSKALEQSRTGNELRREREQRITDAINLRQTDRVPVACSLGGAKELEVIEVPGHTPGSIMFLDRQTKTLAVGDAIGSGMYVWKFTSPSSLSEYRNTLKHLEKYLAEFDSLTFLVGHHWQEQTPLSGANGKRMVENMRVLCEKIISGEIAGTPASTSIGLAKVNVLTARYGLAGIWYDPANIR